MTQYISTATAAAPPATSLDIKLFEHPTRPELQGIEFHFTGEPPEDIKQLLLDNGFRYISSKRNGQRVPRWYRVQSAASWAFAQMFCDKHSHRFGESMEIKDECIPDEFRITHEPQIASKAPLPPTPPRAEVPASISKLVLDSAIAHLDSPTDSVSYEVVASDIFGADEPDAKARERLTDTLELLCNTHQLDVNPDGTYSPPSPSIPPVPPQVEPTVEVVPMPTPKIPGPDPFADIFGVVEAISAFAQQIVLQAERKVEIAHWRPEWSGGLYRLFRWRLALSLNTVQAAIALAAEAEAVTAKKTKPEPGPSSPAPVIQLEQQAPSLPETEAIAPPVPSPSLLAPPSLPGSTEIVAETKPKRRKAKKAIRSITRRPLIEGDPIFLGDDELRDTEGFIGCYAVLDDQIGLSFKGLVDPLTFFAGKPYTAQPGTFQPITMPEFACARLKAMIALWDTYIELIDLEATPGQADEFIESRRSALTTAYDQFVLEHGSIISNAKLTHFYGITDNRLSLLQSLETEDSETGEIQKARLFFQRCVIPAAAIDGQVYFQADLGARCSDALVRCMDIRGCLDLELIAKLTGLEPSDCEEQLLHDEHIFRDPDITGGHRGNL